MSNGFSQLSSYNREALLESNIADYHTSNIRN